MGARTYQTGRVIVARLAHGGDLLGMLTDLAREHEVAMASVSAIGALSRARLAFYDHTRKTYDEFDVDEPLEILACVGNVSRRGGDTAVHAHVTLSRRDGSALGGHLIAGCPVFACEAVLVELQGEALERSHDEVTGLPLWRGL
jgi:predicted DNA-binding protein with PD1-like motif